MIENNQDIADFIAGERSALEGAVRNLRLVPPIDSFTAMTVKGWIDDLNRINHHMSMYCDHLRRTP